MLRSKNLIVLINGVKLYAVPGLFSPTEKKPMFPPELMRVLRQSESQACALAANNLPSHSDFKLGRAAYIQVYLAAGNAASYPASHRGHRHWKIETIHQADIIVMERRLRSSKCHFHHCGWRRSTTAFAIQIAIAVTSLAKSLSLFIKTAALATPYPSRPAIGHVEGHLFAYAEMKSSILWRDIACTALCARPDAAVAVVYKYELDLICRREDKEVQGM
ncbi:hypothetical protein M5K25_015510 [Dendrobium thyrsiflorum]|uniref:Uncharacterized protein n=1 Tax=Dendrobium thyrsiflorum TaxID=117978 RepID=A0ABD0UXE0_DENTH